MRVRTRRWSKWKTRGVGEHFVQLGLLLLWLRVDWAEPFNIGGAKEEVVLTFIVLCVRVTLLRVFCTRCALGPVETMRRCICSHAACALWVSLSLCSTRGERCRCFNLCVFCSVGHWTLCPDCNLTRYLFFSTKQRHFFV